MNATSLVEYAEQNQIDPYSISFKNLKAPSWVDGYYLIKYQDTFKKFITSEHDIKWLDKNFHIAKNLAFIVILKNKPNNTYIGLIGEKGFLDYWYFYNLHAVELDNFYPDLYYKYDNITDIIGF